MTRPPTRVVPVVRRGAVGGADDPVAVEEPLEIRLAGETFAITMRTPGNDRELVVGFLFAEGVITGRDDVLTITPCGRATAETRENTVDVLLAPGVRPPIDAEAGLLARRGTLTTSACGVCGRTSIDDLTAGLAPVPAGPRVAASAVLAAVAGLRDRQPIFARTGGCHAASLVGFDGAPRRTHEDVGRHNAVDKVIGAEVLAGRAALPEHVLIVSGRASFELVQKAFRARIPVVASVSAPSSLAVDLAVRSGITLAGFVRGETMTVYAGNAIAVEA